VGNDIAIERRTLVGSLELRSSKSSSSPGTIVGYAAKYKTFSQDLGGFVETLAPGCFDLVMNDDCRCLRNHLDDSLLGRTKSGTLVLSLDQVGLRYECELPNTTAGRDTAESVRRRDMSGSSFQFSILQGGEKWDFDSSPPTRTVTKIGRLYDVSPVTNPAYLDTQVDMRSFQEARSLHSMRKLAAMSEADRAKLSRMKATLRLLAISPIPGGIYDTLG
jgi:uncharacterized protein